jgi:hypothetical protein
MPRFSLILVTTTTLALALFQLGGCGPERHMAIPAAAMMVQEGATRLAYTTDRAGTLYVHDKKENRLVYSGEADGVREIIVDPVRNEVTVDGELVQDKNLVRGHTHTIYFEPSDRE